ncbi:potassium-transporting ATPase subunit B, partial [bacterium]|nr:potassium-transporting ATPase subunit B [bacterium]
MKSKTQLSPSVMGYAIKHAVLRMHPWALRKNPVILATYLSALVSTLYCFKSTPSDLGFEIQISIWLWLTVAFANFAEALAEGSGKAHWSES